MQSREVVKTNQTKVEPALLSESEIQTAPEKEMLLARLRRRFLDTYHHRPRRLFVAINGITVASLDIASRKNELRVSTNLAEPLQFVEVFSEQDVRLALVNAGATYTDINDRKANISLSDGRRLKVTLKETTNGLSMLLSYS